MRLLFPLCGLCVVLSVRPLLDGAGRPLAATRLCDVSAQERLGSRRKNGEKIARTLAVRPKMTLDLFHLMWLFERAGLVGFLLLLIR
uniref:Secreted protein n=1 Tax=Knipowitschia caucasica TaxID=637954 RepID=A0AAV2LIF5_KNICA